jgi:uncharacterized protein (TIGR00369 family)
MAPPGGPRAGDPYAEYLGMRWTGPDEVRLTIRPDLVNNIGHLLGPVGFALVDYCMGAAAWETLNEGEVAATVNVALNYLDTAREGEVVCRARVDRRSRRAAATSAEVRHEDGRLLITAIGSFAVILPRATPGGSSAPR